MKNKTIEYFIDELNKLLQIDNLFNDIKRRAYDIYADLIKKYKSDPYKLKKLTKNNMYPIMAVYKAMVENFHYKNLVIYNLTEINKKRVLNDAKKTGKMLKVFHLYKIYPWIFKRVTLKSFNKDIGFDPEFVISDKNHCKFNMNQCIFCKRCKEEDCFELVPVFCRKDDVFNSNLHENIAWHRDSTLAEGAKCCDFDVRILN